MIKLFNTKKEIKLNKFIGRGGRFLILREAKKRKINCQVLIQKGRKKEDEDVLFIRFEKNGKKRWLSPQRGYFNPKQACELALFKDLTYQILRRVMR